VIKIQLNSPETLQQLEILYQLSHDISLSIEEIETLVECLGTAAENVFKIKSRNDAMFNDESIKEEWDAVINSIGNLMILESDINRSIKNDDTKKKLDQYKKSDFTIVKDFHTNYCEWSSVSDIEQRKEDEIQKINGFIFEA